MKDISQNSQILDNRQTCQVNNKRQLQCSLTSQQREQCVTLLFIFIIIIDILKPIDLPSQQLLYRELKMQFV